MLDIKVVVFAAGVFLIGFIISVVVMGETNNNTNQTSVAPQMATAIHQH